MTDSQIDPIPDPPAVALGKLRWAGTTPEQRSAAMRELAHLRAKKLSKRRRAEIAAKAGRANTGKRKPGAGRPRKKPQE